MDVVSLEKGVRSVLFVLVIKEAHTFGSSVNSDQTSRCVGFDPGLCCLPGSPKFSLSLYQVICKYCLRTKASYNVNATSGCA